MKELKNGKLHETGGFIKGVLDSCLIKSKKSNKQTLYKFFFNINQSDIKMNLLVDREISCEFIAIS